MRGGSQFRTTESELPLNTRRKSLECSNAFTQPQIIPARVWASQYASALWSAAEDGSGLSLSSAEVQRFSLRFPPQKDNQPTSKARYPNILWVEDNAGDVELVVEALEEHAVSCELLVVSNGERAMIVLDEMDAGNRPCPDLFMLDLNLPRRSGIEILERLRAGPTCPHVPVVILTSSDSQKDKDAVARFNPSRYLRKPLTLESFLRLGGVFKELLRPTV
jgi:CheY-like chemotaxis protein